jgi:hypothetical protein
MIVNDSYADRPLPHPEPAPKSRRRYDRTVAQALGVAWEASDRLCGKRLKPLLPVLLPVLVRHGHLQPDPAVHAKLLAVSAATIDRLLRHARAAPSASRSGSHTTVIRRSPFKQAPSGRAQARPGYLEMQLIPHRGEQATDPAAQTLRLIDLDSEWTERAPLSAASECEVIQSLDALAERFPFTCRGLLLGAELAFCEEALSRYCSGRQIELISAPRHGGAQGRIDHRNDPVVPIILGARKLQGEAAVAALSSLYAASGPYLNFFYPCPYRSDTPYTRLLASGALSEQQQLRFRRLAEALDPLQLLAEMRALQTHIRILSAGFLPHSQDPQPLHRQGNAAAGPASGRRRWRTHRDAFEAHWPLIQAWDAEDPHQTGIELFERLRRAHPGVYREGQLRSLQRRLKQWRGRIGASRGNEE